MHTPHFVRISILLTALVIMVGAFSVHAQGVGENVAVTYPVSEEGVQPGDIIVRDRRSGTMQFSQSPNSPNVFGIIVSNPIILFQTNATNSAPIVRSGQAPVNVTLAGGEIQVGDVLTTSYVPGYARKAGDDDTYQVGVALEQFTGAGSTTLVQAGSQGENEVPAGQILVDIDIRPIKSDNSSGFSNNPLPLPIESDSDDTLLITKLIVAGVIAVGSIYSSFRYFGSTLSSSVDSVGRNPMAKKDIRRMLIMNILAIVSISAAGIGLSIFILLFPL